MQYSPYTKRGAEWSNLVSQYTVPFPIHYILLTSLRNEDVTIILGSRCSVKVESCLQVPVRCLSHRALENRFSFSVAKAQFVRITQLRGLHHLPPLSNLSLIQIRFYFLHLSSLKNFISRVKSREILIFCGAK
jgi:hypothetical protein